MSPAAVSSERPPRRKTVAFLLVVASILTLVAIFSFWVNRQAMNTDNWVDASSELLENEEIQAQLATFLVTQLYANVDVETLLEEALPPEAEALAGPAAGGLRQLAQQVAERALSSSPVQMLWADANRIAHEQLLAVIEDDRRYLSTGEGQVTLQLGALVEEVGGQIGVPADLTAKLPESAGNLEILDSEELSSFQRAANAIRKLPIVLSALLILLYGGAIALAEGRRRETLRAVGFGFIAAGIVALLLRGLAGNAVTDALAQTAAVEPAVDATWEIGTSLLVTVATSAIAFGLLVVFGTWLAGPTSPAVALRHRAAPYFRDRPGATYAVAAAIWLALIAWAPIAAFREPFGIVFFALLFALGVEALRRQAISELSGGPPEQPAEPR